MLLVILSLNHSFGFAIPLTLSVILNALLDPLNNPTITNPNDPFEVKVAMSLIGFVATLLLACFAFGELNALLLGACESIVIVALHLCLLKRPTAVNVAQTVANTTNYLWSFVSSKKTN